MLPLFAELARPGLLALRRYWKPFVLIEACGLAVVVLYFRNDSVRQAADMLAAWKAAGGVALVAVVGAIAGAILPEIGKAVALGDVRVTRGRVNDVAVHLVLFAFMSVLGDRFYTVLARAFGDGPYVGPIVAKVLIDQMIYSPLLVLPIVAFVFTCRGCGWSLRRAFPQIGAAWYLRRVVTLLIPCWCFWVPMTTLMYALPASLTFCFAMFATAAWGLLMIFVAQETSRVEPAASEPSAMSHAAERLPT